MKVYRVESTGYPENRYVVDTYATREAAKKRKRHEEYKNITQDYVIVEIEVKEECSFSPGFEYRLVAKHDKRGTYPDAEEFASEWLDTYEEVIDKVDDEQFIRDLLSDDLAEELEDWQIMADISLSVDRKHRDDKLARTDLIGNRVEKTEEEQHWIPL